jgi:hypothetical protein
MRLTYFVKNDKKIESPFKPVPSPAVEVLSARAP